jgi:hypothetical protein
MKYTKIFKNIIEYSLFKTGENWAAPNVSIIATNMGMKYKSEHVQIISFSFDSNVHSVPLGTTWFEWYQMGGEIANYDVMMGDYNNLGDYLQGVGGYDATIIQGAGASLDDNNNNNVYWLDEIQDGMTYNWDYSGFGK